MSPLGAALALPYLRMAGQDELLPGFTMPHSHADARSCGRATAEPPSTVGQMSVVNPLEQAHWDRDLASWSQASVFHTSAWAQVLRDAYGYQPVYQRLGEEPGSGALLPLMAVKSPLTGRRGIALPFTDACPPLFAADYDRAGLWPQVIRFAKEKGWRYLEFRGGEPLVPEAKPSLTFHGHRLDLVPGEKALFAAFDPSVRRAIRKAEAAGITVHMDHSLAALETYYRLHCLTRKRHGLPPQPWAFFRNIHQHLLSQGMGFIVQATYQGQPLAAAVFLHFGKRAIYKFGASDDTYQSLRPNNLVMWEAIRWLTSHGFQQLCFGRTSIGQDGLRRFKLGWGAVENEIHYYKYDLRHDTFVTDTDQAHGWHNQVFRHMPLALARLAGNLLYPHLC